MFGRVNCRILRESRKESRGLCLFALVFARIRELLAANNDIVARVEKLELSHDRTASVIEILVGDDIDEPRREVKRMKALPS